jgi:hypothetical protein
MFAAQPRGYALLLACFHGSCLVTAPTLIEVGPCVREQVLNGNGTSLALV